MTRCSFCGATDTTTAYYPAQLAWFCVGTDGGTCYARKVARSEGGAP